MTELFEQNERPRGDWRQRLQTVSIIGVGLIGGSFALALRKAGYEGEILGVSSPRTLEEALALGVIDEGAELEQAVSRSDLIYLAHPIQRILDALPRIAAWVRAHAVVTDAGSTKSRIVREAAKYFPPGMFVGGHPMAGKATRGVRTAEAGLFSGRSYILTPEAPEANSLPSVQLLRQILADFGARTLIMDAATHDKVVALTSHLPQLVSTALASTILQEIPDLQYLAVSGGGLADMTRLAGSPFEVWNDIFRTNREAIREVLGVYVSLLESARDHLEDGALREVFERAASVPEQLKTLACVDGQPGAGA
ncbi:MAG: prephenate dehydrogenase/arogenate dehydrogenase family protein [Bryobacteraceae bacterium]|nr:prephenate dehydrogenase/arogenate dehydrogenase family protein [Bryobacteraceae bacterium]MDW8377889.1 prephenate dehydrogenase/arogenate dehydrogenase family protein [Bryobacterales bacterium]